MPEMMLHVLANTLLFKGTGTLLYTDVTTRCSTFNNLLIEFLIFLFGIGLKAFKKWIIDDSDATSKSTNLFQLRDFK